MMSKMTFLVALLLVLFCLIVSTFSLDLTILHTNDVHAHYDQMNKYAGTCSPKDAAAEKCYGGAARRVTKVREIRNTHNNVLLLSAGDRFVGTLWFVYYKGRAAAHFMKKLKYDAMCLGNHEFDKGVDGLLPFVTNLTQYDPKIPIVDANIDISREPRLQGLLVNSTVLTVAGEKIGVVGYTTKATAMISNPGKTIVFEDEVKPVQAEVDRLRSQGINKIIALGHSGYVRDKQIAAAVEGLDLIIGGHTNTFLYNGTAPSVEKIEGPYPTVIHKENGNRTLVVQDYAWGKYLGYLNITFDDTGVVTHWSGNPILLDSSVEQDNETLQEIKEWSKPLEGVKKRVVGETAVRLEGEYTVCRLQECNLGNLIADGWVSFHISKGHPNDTWTVAPIAILNSGGIRASIDIGNITMGDVLTVLPFGNNVDMVTIKGVHLRQVLEHSVANYSPEEKNGAFLQFSGLRVKYNICNPVGSRVVSAETRCRQCQVPTYSPLNDDEIYHVLALDFTIRAGDDYTMLKNNLITHVRYNSPDKTVFSSYLTSHKPVFPETEGRIQFVPCNGSNNNSSHTQTSHSSTPRAPVGSTPHGGTRRTTLANCPTSGANIVPASCKFLSVMLILKALCSMVTIHS